MIRTFFLMLLVLMPGTLAYSCATTQSSIELGNSTVVCVHIVYTNSSGNDTTTTYAFKMTVDKFSAFKISNLKGSLATSSPVKAVIQPQNSAITLQLPLVNPTLKGGAFRSLFSFVVNIEKGVVTAITDDTADCGNCDTGSGQACDLETSYKCYTKGTYTGSDPRFFISWIGTDASGNYMLSHTKRLSRFTQYSIGSVYNKVITTFQ